MSVARALPISIVGKIDKFAKLVNNHLGPLVGSGVKMSIALWAKINPEMKARNSENTGGNMDGNKFERWCGRSSSEYMPRTRKVSRATPSFFCKRAAKLAGGTGVIMTNSFHA